MNLQIGIQWKFWKKNSGVIRRSSLLFLFLAFSLYLKTQVPAPALICVNNDTLVWETPTVTCGSITGYRIYGSQNDLTNFQVIRTVDDPTRQTFFHQEAGGSLWYYYMETIADCPTQALLASDTLDNRIPVISPLAYVSVVGDAEVEIAWKASPSPEVFAYIILKNTPSGTQPIDTVFGATSYRDRDEAIQREPVAYYVLAMDRCGNTSLFDASHQTIFLESGEVSRCDQTIDLKWTAYNNWSAGVARYEIWYRENGLSPQLAGSVAGNTLAYVFENANDQTEYCFSVRAIENGSDATASSNEVCLTTDIVQPNRLLIAKNASYTAGGSLELSWIWNTDAELKSATVNRAAPGGAMAAIFSFSPTPPLDPELLFDDAAAPGFGEPVVYQIKTLDACDEEATSNAVSSLFLEGLSSADGQNGLTWNTYTHDYGSISNVQIIRTTASGSQVVANLSGNATAYADIIDPNDPDLSSACYYLLATLVLDLPDIGQETLELRSNTVCLDQTPGIYIPNVFAPGGTNNPEFRPYLQFGDPQEYRLMVFDRYGSLVFESRDPGAGWNGTHKDKALTQGTYVYVLQMKLSNGKEILREGSVLLLR
ncbi:MAG: gliding motility-associated C-terminal domain-containing protein [Saprospiraceae bacterium]|nr:gliding motility-associated C-terminal domain-containing protein [Saprospiraceae bacterium]